MIPSTSRHRRCCIRIFRLGIFIIFSCWLTLLSAQPPPPPQTNPVTLSETPITPAQLQLLCETDTLLPGCNSCLEERLTPGCNDPTCEQLICNDYDWKSCCTLAWTVDCVTLAEIVCQPEIFPWKSSDTVCPLGFICDQDYYKGRRMADCSAIQNFTRTIQLGGLYNGIYCPRNETSLYNCPIGWYCTTPTSGGRCPKGKFCPHKSQQPWITCRNCPETATSLKRSNIGTAFFTLFTVLLLLAALYAALRRYKKELFKQQYELLARQTDSIKFLKRRKERQEQLQKLKPKLDIIAKRLENTSSKSSLPSSSNESQSNTASSGRTASTIHSDAIQMDKLIFDSKKLYDALDTDEDGILTYDELNAVLELNDYELKTFIRRMNELGGNYIASNNIISQSLRFEDHHEGEDDEVMEEIYSNLVTRPVFVRYFLQVLEETNQLSVTTAEAAELWDQMERDHGGHGYVTETMLYDSSLSSILSDQQIYTLIKKFRHVYAVSVGDDDDDDGDEEQAGIDDDGAISTEIKRLQRSKSTFSMRGKRNMGAVDGKAIILRSVFMIHYPKLLMDVTSGTLDDKLSSSMRKPNKKYVDITFRDLSLAVQVAGKQINVVDHVTGRLQEQTMTALMGGSGAGKTSLLNALCGRAYYGEVLGEIYINGQLKDIGEIADSVGFVPQDDIVYAELTVRENLIYTGKFLLPKGTQQKEIEELADETLASLGLSRVANSMVGDVKRRGVSGGEKKRVNIGLELMKRPECVFLDEPTSGLDASSALLVMESLKHLVSVQGVTIVSVIHQPRKFIFDLFDSLILLGVGGRMVYHGPTDMATPYFQNLGYVLPEGESVADWLIDISSGRLEPSLNIASTKKEEETETRRPTPKKQVSMLPTRRFANRIRPTGSIVPSSRPDSALMDKIQEGDKNGEEEKKQQQETAAREEPMAQTTKKKKKRKKKKTSDKPDPPSTPTTTSEDAAATQTPRGATTTDKTPGTTGKKKKKKKKQKNLAAGAMVLDAQSGQFGVEIQASQEEDDDEDDTNHNDVGEGDGGVGGGGTLEPISDITGARDDDVGGIKGISGGKAANAFEVAKARRAWLYDKWNTHFDNLSDEERDCYEKPAETDLPADVIKQPFHSQLYNQMTRAFLVSYRNYVEKLIDTAILVIATIVICLLSGLPELTRTRNPKLDFDEVVRPRRSTAENTLRQLFEYATHPQIEFPLKIGVIVAVLIGLQSTKIITKKRIEFFREASSGYNINAYFTAINVVATVEHSLQTMVVAFFAAWLRDPVAGWQSFFVHFVMLTWICVSWGLFVPMVVPADNVVIVIGFFMAFCGLLISGALPPVEFRTIYEDRFTEHLAAWLSPTRFFFEALMVGDLRCLPEQSGMTVSDESIAFPRDGTALYVGGLARHDPNVSRQDCGGWYWSILPAFFIGITIRYAAGLAMHAMNRSQQTKKPLLYEMRRNRRVCGGVCCYGFVLIVLGVIASITYTVAWPRLYAIADDYVDYVAAQNPALVELFQKGNFTPEELREVVDSEDYVPLYNATDHEELNQLLREGNYTEEELQTILGNDNPNSELDIAFTEIFANETTALP